MEENSEKIWKIWKKDKLNSDKIWKIRKKIVKRYGKYGRKY
jgi:outer membrane protein assembly factor BamA